MGPLERKVRARWPAMLYLNDSSHRPPWPKDKAEVTKQTGGAAKVILGFCVVELGDSREQKHLGIVLLHTFEVEISSKL